MKMYLPTYKEAKEMVSENGELVFYETVREIDGYKVSTFNYRLPLYTNFINPLKNNPQADAKELRGLTYVFNLDGTLYKRYLLLRKFWNIDQVPESMYHLVKDYKLLSSYNKEDGSLITFIRLPNGRVVVKTKMGFDNEQTIEVEKFYAKNEHIRYFVEQCLDDDIISSWEYVSFKNKIVLDYSNTNLILLKLRDNKTGLYLDIEAHRGKGFDVAEQDGYTMETAIEDFVFLDNKEGSVFTLEKSDGSQLMVKKKTDWYFDRHNLLTNEINREDYVIKSILNETIDDIVSQLEPSDTEKRDFIEKIEVIVRDFLIERTNEVNELVSKYEGDMKPFAIRYKKDKNFGMAVAVIQNRGTVHEIVSIWLEKQTNRLESARSFVNRKGFKRK